MPRLFQFQLKPLHELLAHWESLSLKVPLYTSNCFSLSDGWFWMNTPQGRLPTLHPASPGWTL